MSVTLFRLLHTLNNIQRREKERENKNKNKQKKKTKMGNNSKNKIVAAVAACMCTREKEKSIGIFSLCMYVINNKTDKLKFFFVFSIIIINNQRPINNI
jgi:hypothetical protein